MKITTQAFNFTPSAFELKLIQEYARTQDWDAGIDLAYRNILYDELRSMWVRVPEPDFDRRRSGGHDTGQYDIYLQHEARRWNGAATAASAQYSRYGSWYSSFLQELDALDFSSLIVPVPYAFIMELFDSDHDPEWAARLFTIAQYERHARQMEMLEVLA